eukprot:4827040-Ditylum_brightwellii.AAC.1
MVTTTAMASLSLVVHHQQQPTKHNHLHEITLPFCLDIKNLFTNEMGSPKDSASDIKLADDAIVIFGFGVVCQSGYEMLQKAGANKKEDIVAYSLDSSRVATSTLSGASVVVGDGARYDVYKATEVTKPKVGSQPRHMDALKQLRAALPQNSCIYVQAANWRE